jgi:hypothetical protein
VTVGLRSRPTALHSHLTQQGEEFKTIASVTTFDGRVALLRDRRRMAVERANANRVKGMEKLECLPSAAVILDAATRFLNKRLKPSGKRFVSSACFNPGPGWQIECGCFDRGRIRAISGLQE